MLATVFDLFMQVDTSLDRSQGGLGIGLTLVRAIVELHRGGIRARSRGLGKGSRFVFWLPALPAGVTVPHAKRNGAHASERQARRLLLVDDNVDAVESLAILLKARATTCAPRTTARARWRWWNRSSPTSSCSTSAFRA
jgi:hypothetical protein